MPGRGHGDTSDEYKIYVYDTSSFSFYRGEQYHQVHQNAVLGRYAPDFYTGTLKVTQAAAGPIDPTGCQDQLLDLSRPVASVLTAVRARPPGGGTPGAALTSAARLGAVAPPRSRLASRRECSVGWLSELYVNF